MLKNLHPRKFASIVSIAPGAIKTPINKSAWDTPEAEANLLKLIPDKRVGDVEDIAKAAV
ncbi:MAG: SDR family oxidoreductase [Nostoc sp.]|uniref:SDR family oxidoreductase n=1 Tax=Nostoc sp. TaxID=1180 RepID=UPI002FFBA055